MSRCVIALPLEDFDPTEAAVPWKRLVEAGHEVCFATPDATVARGDEHMIAGVFFGQIRALPKHAELYREMVRSPAFQRPLSYDQLDNFALLVLPGGHAPGMRPYLEDETLQAATARHLEASLVGAICHGTIVLARTKVDGKPVLSGRRVTTLPRRFERGAWLITKPTHGDTFRTYPEWVQDEVVRALGPEGSCDTGPFLPLHGDGFVVRDGNLITARWPGDAERFAQELVAALG